MFTGIITGIGTIQKIERKSNADLEFTIETPYQDAEIGESIAIEGVCLTVVPSSNKSGTYLFYVSPETLSKTTFESFKVGRKVNLERALKVGDRLSGHWVQGHVDGIATLASVKKEHSSTVLGFKLPSDLAVFTVEKGSICIDGISLTINSIENSTIYLNIIPHTWEQTTLSQKQVGQASNVEVDVVAKYLKKWQAVKST